jgi:hypothetical protein
MKERIIEFLDYLKIGQNEFEKICNLANASISNGRCNFTSKKLENIINAYPDLNIHWLITGKGEMLRDQSATNCGIGHVVSGHGNIAKGNIQLTQYEQEIKSLKDRIKDKDEIITLLKQQLKDKNKKTS